MKLLIILLSALVAVASVVVVEHEETFAMRTAGTSVEFNMYYIGYCNLKIAAEGKIFRNFLLSQITKVCNTVEYFNDIVGHRYRFIGAAGPPIADKIEAKFNELIANFKTLFPTAKLQGNIDNMLDNAKIDYLTSVQKYVNKLKKTEIGRDCYYNHRETLKTISDNVAKQIRSDIKTEMETLESFIKNESLIANTYTDNHRSHLERICGLGEACNSYQVRIKWNFDSLILSK